MMNDETRAFIMAHRMENVRDLALHAKRGGNVDMAVALNQIAGWQTARMKLPDWAACDGIIYPPHLPMEQCSSQAPARYKAGVAQRITGSAAATNGSLVDLTGGFGVDFSYMARAFGQATYVERQPDLCELAEHNMGALGLRHVRIVNDEAEHFLQTMGQATLVFLDPARRNAHGARTYAIADCTPNVLALVDTLLEKAPHAMVKLSPMLDWHKTVEDFGGSVHEVHIVSTGDECKELLLVIGRERRRRGDRCGQRNARCRPRSSGGAIPLRAERLDHESGVLRPDRTTIRRAPDRAEQSSVHQLRAGDRLPRPLVRRQRGMHDEQTRTETCTRGRRQGEYCDP